MKNTSILVLLTLALTGCNSGGSSGDGGASTTGPVDDGYIYTPPQPKAPENPYLYQINLQGLDLMTNTSGVGIGVIDGGAEPSHIEFNGRLLPVGYDHLAYVQSTEGELTQTKINWMEGLDHGTHVSALAAGKNIGIGQDAYVYSSVNPWVGSNASLLSCTDVFFTPDNSTYACQINEMLTAANSSGLGLYDGGLSVFNWSFEIYNNLIYQKNPVLTSEITSYGESQTLSEFYALSLRGYGAKWESQDDFSFASDSVRQKFKTILNQSLEHNGRVVVVAAGNSRWMGQQSYTEEFLEPLSSARVSYPSNPLVSASTSIFEDTGPEGLAESFIFALNGFTNSDTNEILLADSSHFPGSDPLVQARFVMAPGTAPSAFFQDLNRNGQRDDYATLSGTSMSAPLITGSIAILRSLHPGKSVREIGNAILSSANRSFTNYDPVFHGMGFLDVSAAHDYLLEN